MGDSKRICFIQYLYELETNIEHLSKAVCDNGFDVTIVIVSDTNKAVFETKEGRKYYKIPVKGERPKNKNILYFIYETIKYIRKHNFSVVHIGHSPSYFLLIKLFCSNHINFIYHLLTYPIASTRIRSKIHMIITYFQCLFMDLNIIQSSELKENMIGLRSLGKTAVIPVGFNKKRFYPIGSDAKKAFRARLNVNEKQNLIIYSGIMSQTRQLHHLLEAFKIVLKTFQDTKLLMVGDGDSFDYLMDYSEFLSISNSVIFTGRVKHHDVVNYLSSSDIGISYIPINENYNYNPPLKTFEYLACGIPTIATKTESNKRIINDRINGILSSDNPNDIANSIVALIKDKSLRNLLSQNARQSIMHHDYEHIAKTQLIPIYNRLIYAA